MLAAGLLFTALSTALLSFLVDWVGMKFIWATLLSAEISTLLRFVINEWWVFRSSTFSSKKLWQYHVANAGAFAIWLACSNALNHLGFNTWLSSILAVVFSTGFSFLSNFFWIWAKKRAPVGQGGSRRVVAGICPPPCRWGRPSCNFATTSRTIQDPGIWVIPGGHVGPEETPHAGACREFLEETCYKSDNARPLAQYSSGTLGYTADFDLVFFWDDYDGCQPIECTRRPGADFYLPPGRGSFFLAAAST